MPALRTARWRGQARDDFADRRDIDCRAYEVQPGSPLVGTAHHGISSSSRATRACSSSACAAAIGSSIPTIDDGPAAARHAGRHGPARAARRAAGRAEAWHSRSRRSGRCSTCRPRCSTSSSRSARRRRPHARRPRSEDSARSVFLRRISRSGTPVPIFPATRAPPRRRRSPSSGPRDGSPRPSARIGVPDRATDVTDMVLVAFGIVVGAFIGMPALMLGGVEIGLSLSVGVLVGGLVCGWLRSMWPRFFGRIPAPTLWVFESLGLAGFVAVVGLNAGPDFVVGLRTSGASLLVAGLRDRPRAAPRRRRGRPVGVQHAAGRAARRLRRRRNRDACTRGDPGGGEELRADARIRRLPTRSATCCSRSGARSSSR